MDADAKMRMDDSLAKKVKEVLVQIIGTNKIVVIVDNDYYTEKEKKEIKVSAAEKQKNVLPGVPEKVNVAEKSKVDELASQLSSELAETSVFIKKMRITIYVDESMSERITETCKKLAMEIARYSQERGDEIFIKKMAFQKDTFSWVSLMQPPNVFWVLGIFLLTIFVFATMVFFFNPFQTFSKNFISAIVNYINQQQTRVAEDTGQDLVTAVVDQAAGQDGSSKYAAGSEEEKKHFYFVNSGNLNVLVPIIQQETAKNIAIVINYLDKDLTSMIFSSLNATQQHDVLIQLSAMQEIDPELVKLVEQKIKNKLNYTLGNEEAVVNLITYMDKTIQNKVLTALRQTNPAITKRIEKLIFSFEDIVGFGAQTIQTVLRRTNMSVFAQLLKTETEEFRKQVLDALPEATQKRLLQEIEMGKPLSEKRVADEKRRIIDLIRHLYTEGLIQINK
jgi:flagellar motor switch protein FliG